MYAVCSCCVYDELCVNLLICVSVRCHRVHLVAAFSTAMHGRRRTCLLRPGSFDSNWRQRKAQIRLHVSDGNCSPQCH